MIYTHLYTDSILCTAGWLFYNMNQSIAIEKFPKIDDLSHVLLTFDCQNETHHF